MKSDSTVKTVRLRTEVVDKVQKMAEADNRTFTNMVETLLINATESYRI